MIRIVFMGTPLYATTIFQFLLKEPNFDVVAVFTKEDKRGNRNKITPPHIKQYIIDNNININMHQPNKLDNENYEIIKNYHPDYIIVAAYGQILKKDILNLAPCINLHASILPKYRGASPIQDYILSNDKYTAITAMLMNEGLDTGDILSFSTINGRDKNISQLMDELSIKASSLTIKTIKNFKELSPIKQHSSISSYAKKVKKSDGKIDFINAKKIYKQYLAYKSWPSIFMDNGTKITKLKLHDENTIYDKSAIILEIKKESIIISTLKGSLETFYLHPPSKKEIDVISYIKNNSLNVGDSLI